MRNGFDFRFETIFVRAARFTFLSLSLCRLCSFSGGGLCRKAKVNHYEQIECSFDRLLLLLLPFLCGFSYSNFKLELLRRKMSHDPFEEIKCEMIFLLLSMSFSSLSLSISNKTQTQFHADVYATVYEFLHFYLMYTFFGQVQNHSNIVLEKLMFLFVALFISFSAFSFRRSRVHVFHFLWALRFYVFLFRVSTIEKPNVFIGWQET